MKERPILFSAPMVRALLNGTKTQTRRVCTPANAANLSHVVECPYAQWGDEDGEVLFKSPYGVFADRLWVRESFSGPHCMEKTDEFPALPPGQWPPESSIWYWADGEPTHGDWTRPRPSIHMPRWASRITLLITNVRVERLQDISEADAMAEGIVPAGDGNGFQLADTTHYMGNPIDSYFSLWEAINGAESVEANPWVWAVEFKRKDPA